MAILDILGFEVPPLLLLAVTLFVILLVKSWAETPRNIPPYPARPIPVVGHLPYMGEPRKKLLEWRKTTGDIFSLYFGSSLIVVISSYDLLRETLVKQAEYFSHRHKHGIIPILKAPHGLVGSSGETWKENRTLALNLLRAFGMGKSEMAENILEEVSAYLAEVSKSSGKPIDPKDLTQRSVSNVLCRFIMGRRFEYDDPAYARLLELYDEAVNLAMSSGPVHWFPNLKYLPGDPFCHKKLLNNDKEFRAYSGKLIESVLSNGYKEGNEDNFIAFYIDEMKKREADGKATNLSLENLDRAMGDLLVAGTETTTTTILWFYLYMVHFPDIQDKIYKEIEHVVGTSRMPSVSDKAKMPYLNATILEVQRISSIVPLGLLHRCTEDRVVRGYTIPADTLIMPHLDAALLDEKIWGDPLKFRPERFLNNQQEVVQHEQMVAFSLGRRICLGEALAKMELFLFMAAALQKFEITPRDPDNLPPLIDVMGLTNPPIAFDVKFVERI